jgi:hypothetical protein
VATGDSSSGPSARGASPRAWFLGFTFAALAAVLATLHLDSGTHPEAGPRPRSHAATVLPVKFAQAQSFLEEFRGHPLLAANFDGAYRPFSWVDRSFTPLFGPSTDKECVECDFYDPTPLSDDEVLFDAQENGKRPFDIFLFNAKSGTLRNLTSSPGDDEGDYCVERTTRRIAFGRNAQERFGVVNDSLAVDSRMSGPGFARCVFENPDTVLGVSGARDLFRCTWGSPCTSVPLEPPLETMSGLFRAKDGTVGVLGIVQGTSHRRAFALDGDRLTPIPARPAGPAGPAGGDEDVFEYDGNAFRLGLHARFWSSLAPSDSGIVSVQKEIGGVYYGIVANAESPRTLAELANGRWSLHEPPGASFEGGRPAAPEEVWLTSSDGGRHQAFLFPAATVDRAVLWLHGGPHENVSPRYSPYFDRLNQLGFSVLALNYPGSSGEGHAYETEFADRFLVGALQAATAYLAARGARVVVSWSISSGAKLQRLLLANHVALSGMIDQAGFDNTDLRSLLAGLPYFSIRGAFDDVGRASGFDYVYPGGHDITRPTAFDGLFQKLEPFLASLAATERDGSVNVREPATSPGERSSLGE